MKPTPGLMRCLLWTAISLLTAAADAAEPGRAAFSTSADGQAGACLVAGPFDAPQGRIERLYPAAEGEDGWSLLVGSDQGLQPNPDGRPGFYYLRFDFDAGAEVERKIVYYSTAPVVVWAGAQTTASAPFRQHDLRTPAARFLPVVFRLETAGAAALRVRVEVGDQVESAWVNLADASETRLWSLFERSLRLRVNPSLAQAGSPVLAELSLAGSVPVIDTAFRVAIDSPDGALEPRRDFSPPPMRHYHLARAPQRLDFTPTPDAPGLARIRARLLVEDETVAEVTTDVAVREGLAAEADALNRAAQGIPDALESVRAYVRLQADKLRLALATRTGVERVAQGLRAARGAIELASEGSDFQAGRAGFLERAYVSEIDDSPQPYLVYVPSDYSPDDRRPLVVYLHGYVPTYDRHDWLWQDSRLEAVMEAEGCILAIPFGRSNTDFLNVGEDDVLRVVELMRRDYSIDPDRIYLYGYSMGGSGVWTMLAHYPDLFAAGVVLAGRTDYFLWHRLDRAALPPWRRFVIETDNPMDMAENIAHIPVRVYHGTADSLVRPAHSERMKARLDALGGRCELLWLRGGGHWSFFDHVLWRPEAVQWLKRHTRRMPERAKVIARHPRYARAWGAEFDRFTVAAKPATLSADFTGGKPSLDVSGALVRGDGESTPGPTGLGKTRALAGPVKDAFRGPFAIVYGSGEEAQANARTFAREWREFAKGEPMLLSDGELTEEVAASRNLFLFGTPEDHAYLERIAPRLPVDWSSEAAHFGGHSFPMRSGFGRRGLVFIQPNPEHPERYVAVWSGIHWGASLPVNHKWDLIPDLMIYEDAPDQTDPMERTNLWVAAGFFGPDWSVESGQFWVRDRGELKPSVVERPGYSSSSISRSESKAASASCLSLRTCSASLTTGLGAAISAGW